MRFGSYHVQYYPGFVMNESKLFFEAEQSDLPRPKKNYCLHVDGMALMMDYGLKLIREWNMPMEIRPVWVGDRKCMCAWLLPRNYGTTLFLDSEFQARLAKFKEVARIPGPPNEQPRWLALRDGDLPHTFVPGKRWADEAFRSQSIQDTPLYLNSCANCDKSDPYVWEEGGAVDDDQEDEDEAEGEDVNSDSGEEDYSGREEDDGDDEEGDKIKQALE
ncbi:hypothetical protein PC9H_005909 [Pleurotus ostreatus]|uniref:Uncharacterized protein n=1 Tax=Pleurotus ostreatus TaxID=5322 RepID=A0A8H6ZWN1_PLEOS|nr:uncharacterized protein PC9H_005909 [Pleurotus ostreatus]KAF7430207.1 hypothetical protein PC9H_005909 [Pleurotus ostreatus]KAJ8701285.1 hypothetical protein PTI98_000090 [Pleurotus ostreatus]